MVDLRDHFSGRTIVFYVCCDIPENGQLGRGNCPFYGADDQDSGDDCSILALGRRCFGYTKAQCDKFSCPLREISSRPDRDGSLEQKKP